jgi:hypothetical protein
VNTLIIDQKSQDRESTATHRLLATLPIREALFSDLGLPPLSWFIKELRFSTLGLAVAGEIDVVGGLLAPTDLSAYEALYREEQGKRPLAHPKFLDIMATQRFVQEGGVAWPPRTDFLVGVEVKCAYDKNGRIIRCPPRGLTLEDWLRKLALEEPELGQPAHPFKSGYGMLAKYGPAPSAEELDEQRREMFRGFAF